MPYKARAPCGVILNMPSDFSKFNHPKCQIKVLLLSFFKTNRGGEGIHDLPTGYLARLFQSSYQKYRTASIFIMKLAFCKIQKGFIKKPYHSPLIFMVTYFFLTFNRTFFPLTSDNQWARDHGINMKLLWCYTII